MRRFQCLCIESILESFASTLRFVLDMKIDHVIKSQETRMSHKDSSMRQFGVKCVSTSRYDIGL